MKNHGFRLILVTGIPRSGTTAIGKILTINHGISSLHEPFNEHVGISGIKNYFEFIDSLTLDRKKLDDIIQNIKLLRLKFKPGFFPNEKPIRKALKFVFGGRARNSYRCCRWNPFLHTIIWKDPFACLVAHYISKNHDTDVLVAVRNPWAVAGSFKRMGWGFDLKDIILLKESLPNINHSFHSNIPERFDPIPNSSMLWNLIYTKLLNWSQHNQRIHFVNLDDVIIHPVQTFERVYSTIQLPWNDRVARSISIAYNKKGKRSEPKPKKAHDRNRDINTVNTYWENILTKEEREKVDEMNYGLWAKLRAVSI